MEKGIFLCLSILKRLHSPLRFLTIARQILKLISFFDFKGKHRYKKVFIAGVKCEITSPVTTNKDSHFPTVIYFHGGAFILGLNFLYRQLGIKLAEKLQANILFIDYRLAPEHPFPAALKDCLTVCKTLELQGISLKNPIFAGDSAGGNLLLSTLFSLKEQKKKLPVCSFILSPWTDLTLTGQSLGASAAQEDVINPRHLPAVIEAYTGNHKQLNRENPFLSPFYGNYQGLPPFLFVVGEKEILKDDTLRLVEKIKQKKGQVNLIIGKDMPHDYVLIYPKNKQSVMALTYINDFIQNNLKDCQENRF